MAIDSLRSGAIRICFDDSLNAYPHKCRILIEGQMLDTGTAIDGALRQVPSLRHLDELFGAGSVIAEGMRTAFACCPNNALEFFALPHKDASVGATTKAEYTIQVVGDAATSHGRADFYVGDGRWNTSTRIAQGTLRDDAMVAIATSMQKEHGFPFDVTVAGNTITLIAKNAGTVGNCVKIIYNWHERLDYAPLGLTFQIAQTVVGVQDAFTPPDYAAILGECCYCCIGGLYDNGPWQDALIAYIESAWDCAKPQCFGHGYTYNSGTLGEILSYDTNSPEISRLAHCCDDPSIGWLKVAAYTAQSCCLAVDNPEMSIQGPEFGVLGCVKQPESCFQCFTFDEQQILEANGFVVTVPFHGGSGSMTSPMIVNDITNNRYDATGHLNATWWNVSSRRLAAVTADQMAIELGKVIGLGLFTKNTTIPPGIKGTNPKLILGAIRTWAKGQVGILFSEFENIDKDIQLFTDFEKAPKCQGIPGKLWVNFIYRPPVRISNILINAQPALLSNC
jgi:hypothetical protein